MVVHQRLFSPPVNRCNELMVDMQVEKEVVQTEQHDEHVDVRHIFHDLRELNEVMACVDAGLAEVSGPDVGGAWPQVLRELLDPGLPVRQHPIFNGATAEYHDARR